LSATHNFLAVFVLWGLNFGELATLKGRGVPEGRTAYTLTVEQNGQAGDRQEMTDIIFIKEFCQILRLGILDY
jgi:hypothetical protein